MHDITQTPSFRASNGAELAALLARRYFSATPTSVASVVTAMQAATRAAKKFAEDACNYDLGDSDDPRSASARRQRAQDRKESEINKRLAHPALIHPDYWSPEDKAAPPMNPASAARITLSGDPRGPCARLHIPGMRGDGWGDGFAIY